MFTYKKLFLIVVGWISIALAGPGQSTPNPTPPTNAKTLTYQIISVKLHKPDDYNSGTRLLPDGYTAKGISLPALVDQAYGFGNSPMTDQEVAKAPKWFRSEKFDIDARVDSADVATLQKSMELKGIADQVIAMRDHIPTIRMLMLQELLADRFKMKVHHETKEVPVYALVVAKNGSKLKKSDSQDISKASIESADGEIVSQGMPLIFILRILTQELGRPVLDKTGLVGNYDFKLKWTPDPKMLPLGPNSGAPEAYGPSLFTAIQEQLGLKLESTKAPVDTIVIDHVEMPSEN